MGTSMLRKQSYGNYPAAFAILKCVFEGLQVPVNVETEFAARVELAPGRALDLLRITRPTVAEPFVLRALTVAA